MAGVICQLCRKPCRRAYLAHDGVGPSRVVCLDCLPGAHGPEYGCPGCGEAGGPDDPHWGSVSGGGVWHRCGEPDTHPLARRWTACP